MKRWIIRWAYWLGLANLLLAFISFVLWICLEGLKSFKIEPYIKLDEFFDASLFVLLISMNLILIFSYISAIAYLIINPFSYLMIKWKPELQQYKNALVNILTQPRPWMVKSCIKCMCAFLLIWSLLPLMNFMLQDDPDADLFGLVAIMISLLATLAGGAGCAIGIGYLFIRLCTWASARISKLKVLHATPVKCLLYATVIAFQILSYMYILGS